MKFKWRKWNNLLHRDIGYFFAGLTIIYAISGIAVNHISDWNPNYIIEREDIQLKNIKLNNGKITDAKISSILNRLSIKKRKYKKIYPKKDEVQLFFDNKTVTINLTDKKVHYESIIKRTIFYSFNKLHLNHIKGFWTYFADLYALALIFLAISGMFVLKGKKGLKWRGTILGTLGLLFPIIFLLISL